jgi:hypothetical protein
MPSAVDPTELSIFQQQLIGTWTNQALPGTGKGDQANPYSYNVMVLPQSSPQPSGQNLGYILKNFTYYETIVFKGPQDVASPVEAPNRGSTYQQSPHALFYDQQIRFAEGPGLNQIVHEENGVWLHLQTEKQQVGPYLYPPDDPVFESDIVPPQPPDRTMCKQISVPHGVSVLALGSFSVNAGTPAIPDAPSVLPTPSGIATDPYTQTLNTPDNYQNPQPALTNQINAPIQSAVADLAAAGTPVNSYIFCSVDTANLGAVVNIPFEQQKAGLVGYSAQYWLLSLNAGTSYDILAYTQRILLGIPIGGTTWTFPHPTTNVLIRSTM